MAHSAKTKSSGIWVQGLACGIMLTFATSSVVILLVLFAPALACLVTETHESRGMTRAVALACAAASFDPVWQLWRAGGHMDMAMAILASPATLALAWGGGALAWAICQVLPVILTVMWDFQASVRVKQLEAEMTKINEEWDIT